MQRHQADRRALVHRIGIRHQGRVVQKIANGFPALGRFGGGVDQLFQVFEARFAFRSLIGLQHFAVAGAIQYEAQQLRKRPRAGHQRKFLNQVAEDHQRRLRAGGEMFVVDDPFDGVPQAQAVLARVAFDLLHGGAADAARGRIDNAQQAHRIVVRRRQLQVRHSVLDFRPLVKTEAAHHAVPAPVTPQRFLDLPRLEVGAVEHRHVVRRIGHQVLLDGVGDEQGFVFGVETGVQPQLVPGRRFGPQLLAFAFFVVLHHRAGRTQNVLGGTVILLQPNGLGLAEIALEVENVTDVGAAPAIDRLVLIAHHADVAVLLGEQAHQLVLAAVGVLILVHHDVAQAPVPGLARGIVVLQQAHGFQQQIVEVQGVGGA